jgi:hypothetical protein
MRDFEFRLIEHPSEDGQILAQDMINIVSAAQTLITRLSRAAAQRTGAGRSEAALESLSRVRVTGLREGSTKLQFVFGDPQAFSFDDPLTTQVEEAFWRIVNALPGGDRPADTSDSVAEAVHELIGALRHAAPRAEIGSMTREAVPLSTFAVPRDVWSPMSIGSAELVTYSGVLEALDLRNARFRIADDVSNRITLKDVRDPHEAARLVDYRVRATGRAVYSADGGLKHLADVDVAALDVPSEWSSPEANVTDLLDKPIPSFDGGLDLSDDEFDDFMAAIHG